MSKGSVRSLASLSRIKDSEERAAAERLTAARERLDRERLNLTTVRDYMSEYAERPRGAGDGARLLAEGQRFRLRLEQTVEAQQAVVEHAERQAESARSHWAAIRSEREAMEKLIHRRRATEARRERDSEQKAADEQALQQAVRQPGGGPH